MSQTFRVCKYLEKIRLATPELNISRSISLSSARNGKRNFRKFSLGNHRGTKLFKQQRAAGMYPDLPYQRDVKPFGYNYGNRFIPVPEMIPELMVPDLTGFPLKPYVSYRTPKITEDAFTPDLLFEIVYGTQLRKDLKEGKINDDGTPKEGIELQPEMTPEEAILKARQTGCDIYSERIPKYWECLDIKLP